jgi:hypothetical protein
VTDVATLGLAEIIWSPVQASTRPRRHTVMFCYDHNERLLSMLSCDSGANNSSKFRKTLEMVVPASSTASPPTTAAMPVSHTPMDQAAGSVSVRQATGNGVGNLSNELPATGTASVGGQSAKSIMTTPGA